jgi:hypothetical protein
MLPARQRERRRRRRRAIGEDTTSGEIGGELLVSDSQFDKSS